MSTSNLPVDVCDISYRYATRRRRKTGNSATAATPLALDRVSLQVKAGECFALLGPNGGGKTTLFRLLTTLIPLQSGSVAIFGSDLNREVSQARRMMGVVFQAASLDRKLTIAENLHQQSVLYGLSRQQATSRIERLLSELGLSDRSRDLVEKLSGGQRRRVELAKGLLHEPRLLLLDEPTTGLDPAVRSDVWRHIDHLRKERGVAVLLTTHLLEEAERADRIGIISGGKIVALDTPDQLRGEMGQRIVSVHCTETDRVSDLLVEKFGLDVQVAGQDRIRCLDTTGEIPLNDLLETLGDLSVSVTVGKPTLEDVFLERTGHPLGRHEP